MNPSKTRRLLAFSLGFSVDTSTEQQPVEKYCAFYRALRHVDVLMGLKSVSDSRQWRVRPGRHTHWWIDQD